MLIDVWTLTVTVKNVRAVRTAGFSYLRDVRLESDFVSPAEAGGSRQPIASRIALICSCRSDFLSEVHHSRNWSWALLQFRFSNAARIGKHLT